ncbi:MAG: hypothetical protein JXQ99_11230 [Hyphomicrobiaceae bacterium]
MINLDEDDLAVLSLLAERPLHAPPPLVLGIIQELRPSGLTVFSDGCWHATRLGLEVLSDRKKLRTR